MKSAVRLLVGTRKGAWIVTGSHGRDDWSVGEPIHLGSTVHHLAGPAVPPTASCGQAGSGPGCRFPGLGFRIIDEKNVIRRRIAIFFGIITGQIDQPGP